jgi:hypothetical protein
VTSASAKEANTHHGWEISDGLPCAKKEPCTNEGSEASDNFKGKSCFFFTVDKSAHQAITEGSHRPNDVLLV